MVVVVVLLFLLMFTNRSTVCNGMILFHGYFSAEPCLVNIGHGSFPNTRLSGVCMIMIV